VKTSAEAEATVEENTGEDDAAESTEEPAPSEEKR
jgi:hypothetical protein